MTHPEAAAGPTRPSEGGAVARQFRALPVTMSIVAVNLAMYVASAVQARSVLANNHSQLFADTTLYPPIVAYSDQWWRLLTSAFDHFGPLHLLLNMYMLWLLGLGVEVSVGRLRYAALYLVSALGGSAAVMVAAPDANTAGASGAIFGLMGAYAVLAVALKVEARGILMLIGLNVAISLLVPGVSLAAHLGGLVAGALAALAMIVLPRTLPPAVSRGAREVVSWTGYVLVVALTLAVAWMGAQALLPLL